MASAVKASDDTTAPARDVGVVGAGFAGMAAALFLARAGHRVTLYERAATPGPVGAAIVLQPSGLAVLRRLGLDREVEARSQRLDRLAVRTPRGNGVVDLRYTTIDPTWYGLGVGRGVLFDALWQAVAREPASRVSVVTGVTARELATIPDGRRLVMADGSHRDHELVVVADGSRSALAGAVAPRNVVPYPWGALFHVGPSADTNELRQVARGARTFMGVLPMGGGRASLFWSLRADRVDAWRADFEPWRERCVAFGRGAGVAVEPLVAAIARAEDVLFAPYFDVRMKRWHGERAVVIGDAAHATSPQLGQGSNLALWDALVLADALARDPDLARALASYTARRKRHLSYYQRATRWLTPFFQGDSRVLGWVRDWAFPLGAHLPPVRRLMARSMAGTAAGFFGASEPLPAPWP